MLRTRTVVVSQEKSYSTYSVLHHTAHMTLYRHRHVLVSQCEHIVHFSGWSQEPGAYHDKHQWITGVLIVFSLAIFNYSVLIITVLGSAPTNFSPPPLSIPRDNATLNLSYHYNYVDIWQKVKCVWPPLLHKHQVYTCHNEKPEDDWW